MKKKGQVVNFSSALTFVVSLVVMGLVAGAGLLALAAFRSSYNTANGGIAAVNTTIDNSISGVGNFTAQLPTVGTMIGIGLVLLIIVGVFAFGLMRKGGGGL